jgi:hypothetical protein
MPGTGHRLSPGISRCCKSRPLANGVEDEPNRGLRGQLLVFPVNFVVVRRPAGEPLEWAIPSLEDAFWRQKAKYPNEPNPTIGQFRPHYRSNRRGRARSDPQELSQDRDSVITTIPCAARVSPARCAF